MSIPVVDVSKRATSNVIDGTTIVYVTIGVPFSSIPIMQKVTCFVDLREQTIIQVAKRLRKMVADNIENYGWVKGTHFELAHLYYEIYENVNDVIPRYCSWEAPAMNSAC